MLRASKVTFVRALLPLLIASAGRADTHTVCASGCDFSSIQAAHDAAAAGDTLDIRGTITEQGVVLAKDLLITSSLADPQIVQAALQAGIATDRVFFVGSGIQVTLENLVVRHGVFASAGGGILNTGQLTLERMRLEYNRADNGGGIASQGLGASLVVRESTIQNNRANLDGGGLFSDSGTVAIERSTIAKNRAFEGGGIMNRVAATLTVDNSTVSMNRAPNGGAGIFNEEGASTAVNSCTFALNSLRAIQNNGSTSTFTLRNSLLGNSLTSNFASGGTDCAAFLGGTITDLGHNLVEAPGACTFAAAGSSTGQDPGLGALAKYGNGVRTHALLATSPAIDAGDAGPLTVDQRGFARPQLGADDIGAFEFRQSGEPLRPAEFTAPMVFNGTIHYGEFEAFENRSPNFELLVQDSGGSFNVFAPDPLHHGTFLGTVDELPGAVAGATYFPDSGEHYYHLAFADGREWLNEGGDTSEKNGSLGTNWAGLVPSAGGPGTDMRRAEVGVDLPFDRFSGVHGSDADDALAMIEHSILAANLVYMQQTAIQHTLGRVILRGDPSQDPYATLTTHNEYLTEHIDQWENVLPADTYDLALVVRATGGSGLGQVGRIGTPAGHSSNDATAGGDFSGVWRHEAGHNWFLAHFDGNTPEGPTLNSGNALSRLSGPEQALITFFRDSRSAFLDNLGVLTARMAPFAGTDRELVSAQSTSVVIDVLANDHDPNGEALTLVSVNPGSELSLGGTMVLEPGGGPGGRDAVRYTLPALSGPTGAIDRFRYRIRDASGLESEGFVFVRVVDFDPRRTYQQDFDAFPDGTTDLGDGSYILDNTEGSNAAVLGGALELTEDALGRQASFTLPVRGVASGFTASFRYRITAAGTPADGFAFNFGAPNVTRIPVDGIGDFPSGLTVEWNTFAARGYHVRVNGTTVPGGFVPNTGLVDGQLHDVVVGWRRTCSTGGILSLTVDGSIVFDELEIPNFEPTRKDMLAFSALTVGLSEQVLIDDIDVVGRYIPPVREACFDLAR